MNLLNALKKSILSDLSEFNIHNLHEITPVLLSSILLVFSFLNPFPRPFNQFSVYHSLRGLQATM